MFKVRIRSDTFILFLLKGAVEVYLPDRAAAAGTGFSVPKVDRGEDWSYRVEQVDLSVCAEAKRVSGREEVDELLGLCAEVKNVQY